MSFLIPFLLALIFFLVGLPYLRFLGRKRLIKKIVYGQMLQGVDLKEAIRVATIDIIAMNTKIDLGSSWIAEHVSNEMDKLQKKMDVDNVIDIYYEFIDMYILQKKHSLSSKDSLKIKRAAENMEFRERDGYFALKYKPFDA